MQGLKVKYNPKNVMQKQVHTIVELDIRMQKFHVFSAYFYVAGIVNHDADNYTLYVSPYMVVSKERFTKHYYSGTQRVASKLGVGDFNNLFIQGSTRRHSREVKRLECSEQALYLSESLPVSVYREFRKCCISAFLLKYLHLLNRQ